MENKTCKNVRRLKGTKLEDLFFFDRASECEKASDKVIKEQAKVTGQQVSVTNCVHNKKVCILR
jgi:hypothetical protein